MIYFQYLVLFVALITAAQTNRLASDAEFERRKVHLSEEGRRNLALGQYTSRPKSNEGIQCHDMTWWDDGDGWDCQEWESRNQCDGDYSTSYRNYGFIVDQACCSCGGGVRESGCQDAVYNWYDSYGPTYDCDWYARNAGACERYGYDYERLGHTAKTACCACGGGDTGVWNVIREGRRSLGENENTHAPNKDRVHVKLAPHVNLLHRADQASGRRALDVKDASLSTVLEKMKEAFEEMFPVAKSTNSGTWTYKNEYNFAEFTKAFQLMFEDFDFSAKVPEPSCEPAHPCYTGHSNSAQTTTKEQNIKRVVAFLWAHVKQESDGLKAVKEYSCSSSTSADVCCSYNPVGTTCNANTPSSSKYFGRGALQLSHDYNYKKFGQWTEGLDDVGMRAGTNLNNFIGKADKVATSSYAWLSGMWFFVDAKMHICGSTGSEDLVTCFQRTTNKINGDQECEPTSTTHQNEDKTRIKYLIQAYKALNRDRVNAPNVDKGIPKGVDSNNNPTYYNQITDIDTDLQTCDFCREQGATDCSDEDSW